MANTEFIITLSEHRYLGSVFTPCLIENCGKYYSIISVVKPDDLKTTDSYHFKPFEKELVETAAKYSDQQLMKKFSRAINVAEFYTTLPESYFEKQITPVVEKYLFKMAEILMLSPIRLFRKEAKYSNLYDEDEIKTHPIYARPVFYFEKTSEGVFYKLKTYIGETEINLADRFLKIVSNEPCLLLYKNHLVAFETMNSKKLLPFMDKDFIRIPPTMEEKYFSGFILNTIRDYEVHAKGFSITENTAETIAELRIDKNLRDEFAFVLGFIYGTQYFELNSNRELNVKLFKDDNGYRFEKTIRNKTRESELVKIITEAGLYELNGFFVPVGWDLQEKENAFYFLINWLNENLNRLENEGIRLNREMLLKPYFTGVRKIETTVKSISDWFDVFILVYFGEFTIPFTKLRKYILNNIREFELPDGEIAVLPSEWFTQYKGLFPLAKVNGNSLYFRNYHYTLLRSRLKGISGDLTERFKPLDTGDFGDLSLPEGLNAELRNYQIDGYRWMYRLYQFGFGGCLADDMGLGKTLQALSVLLKLKKNTYNNARTFPDNILSSEFQQPASLIIMPTSLIHNWYNEISKFASGLTVFKYTGPQRRTSDITQILHDFDLILTTYGTVRNDIELIGESEFFYVILDEGQYIKNPASKSYKAVTSLKARHRLVLTGTPIENSLSDLWAQMNFLNKGMLGNLAYFRRYYINPIEIKQERGIDDKLHEMIKPFILRRKKEDVAKDLPPVTEQIIECEMTPEQKRKYESEKSAIRNLVLKSIESKGVNKSTLTILTGLTKLRQLANHPSMVEEDAEEGSGKFFEIIAMLENIIAENHKVLIFSSFVEHLNLVKAEIEKRNWKFAILTGQTADREKVIRKFQIENEIRIFLISLKAGGVGLNLTEADYVFILDPWWNPAAENQAINRAHRIGQDKNVFVYRFITRETIEEKIQLLKDKKSTLADKFINSNNPFEKGATAEEILELI